MVSALGEGLVKDCAQVGRKNRHIVIDIEIDSMTGSALQNSNDVSNMNN